MVQLSAWNPLFAVKAIAKRAMLAQGGELSPRVKLVQDLSTVLEAETRYLAADLGPHNVRVNAISAGPLKTLAGSAVRGVSQARDLMVEKAPLRRNITQDEVGNVAVFLASDWSRAVTGDTIFADNGFNILGVTE